MKRFLLCLILFSPALLLAQGESPKKNKMAVVLLHPKASEKRDFERNLMQHNKDFHKGPGAVDIYEVLAGERTGEFHFIFRNQVSWDQMETAYNASQQKEHADDWDINVAPHLSGSSDSPLFIFETSDDSYLPPNPAEMNADMLGLYFIDLNSGMEEDFFAGIKKIKEMYQKNNSKNYYAIHTNMFGKGTQVVVAFPLAKGWASFEPNPDDDWAKMFKTAFPKEDYKAWMKKFNASQKSLESLVVKYRKDLSSPM